MAAAMGGGSDREWRGRIPGIPHGLRLGSHVDAATLDGRVDLVLERLRRVTTPRTTAEPSRTRDEIAAATGLTVDPA